MSKRKLTTRFIIKL